MKSPLAWGSEAGVRELLGARVRSLRAERKQFMFRYREAAHFLDVFRRYYGPTHKAFETLLAADERPWPRRSASCSPATIATVRTA